MLKKLSRMMSSAIVLLKVGGPGAFFNQLWRQIYSRNTHIGLGKNLGENSTHGQFDGKVKYHLRLASDKDMEEVLHKAKSEVKESVYEVVYRKWLYDCGFHNCYIARTADTDELCYMQFVFDSKNAELMHRCFGKAYPKLKGAEAILEGAYTFGKYRGNGLYTSAMADIVEICRKKGFKRIITYIAKDNTASLKGAERFGFVQFEEVSRFRILFLIRRKRKFNRVN